MDLCPEPSRWVLGPDDEDVWIRGVLDNRLIGESGHQELNLGVTAM